jgi:hypothetical protein
MIGFQSFKTIIKFFGFCDYLSYFDLEFDD